MWIGEKEKKRIESKGGACAILMSIAIEYVCDRHLCIVVSMRRAVEGCIISEGALEEDPIGDCQMSAYLPKLTPCPANPDSSVHLTNQHFKSAKDLEPGWLIKTRRF